MIILKLIKETVRYIRFSWYKSMAITRWKVTGKRHWVIPVLGTNRMTVMNNDQIRSYNHWARKHKYRPVDISVLLKAALYGTPAGTTGERRRK